MAVAPADRAEQCLGGEALTLGPRNQGPADLWNALEGGDDLALEIGKAHLADEQAAALFLDQPIAVTQHPPMAGIAQDPRPHLFARQGLAADEAGHLGIAPHGKTIAEILETVRA